MYMKFTEAQFREMLDRYVKGTATNEEITQLETFFASYDEESGAESFIPGENQLRDEIYDRIKVRAGFKKRRLKANFWKVAASILLVAVVGLAIKLYDSEQTPTIATVEVINEETPRGQKSVIELPDGSIVHLNSATKLTFPKVFGKTREVSLTGEAFFVVKHDTDRPFAVKVGTTAVNVLGTTFNVKATGQQDAAITLVSGKVHVASASDQRTLSPGEQAIVDQHTNAVTTSKVNIRQFISWKENIIYFDQTPLHEAVDMLESWYDTEIIVESARIDRCSITGQYKNEALENVLESLGFLLGAKVNFSDPKRVIISGGECARTN